MKHEISKILISLFLMSMIFSFLGVFLFCLADALDDSEEKYSHEFP